MSRIARVFFAGLLALLPLALTIGVLAWAARTLHEYLGPGSLFGHFLVSLGLGVDATSTAPYIVGLAAVLAGIYVLGLIVNSRLGDWLTHLLEDVIRRIPLVSHVYDLSKRFTSIVDMKESQNLKSMSPVWCFFGGEPSAAVLALLPSPTPVVIGSEEYLGVLVPSSPVPIGGALVYVPSRWVKPAAGGVDELMSVYISMGVTPPRSTVG
ncbi:MAG: DUF502 domain-containing protein [Hyphomicrobiaceae bacterium]